MTKLSLLVLRCFHKTKNKHENARGFELGFGCKFAFKMQFIRSKLPSFGDNFRKFDAHRKTKDVYQHQTLSGAIITIMSIIIVLFLVSNEFLEYNNVEILSTMVPDKTVGIESIDIQFSLIMKQVTCPKIEFKQSVTRGTLHSHEPERITKTAHEKTGCLLEGTVVVDKTDGNFRFKVEPAYSPAQRVNGPDGTVVSHSAMIAPDLSHEVRYLRFIPRDISDEEELDLFPEDSTYASGLVTGAAVENSGLFNYGVRVISTHDHFLNKTLLHKTQLSVTQRSIRTEMAQIGVSVAGFVTKNEYGLFFSYDFYPIMLENREAKVQTLFQFLTGLCAILGGTITVLGLLDRVVHESTKKLMGKAD